MMNIRDIVERINYFRNLKNISARNLSYDIDKSYNYINKLESLNFNPPMSVILDIINALDISPEEFFAEDYKNYSLNKKISNLLKSIINSVPSEDIAELINELKNR